MFPIVYILSQAKSPHRRVVNNVVFSACLVVVIWLLWHLDDEPCFVPKHLRKYLLFPEDYEIPEEKLDESERRQLALQIERLNSQAEVLNWAKYRPIYPDTPIIVITVDKDVERLQYLIISLGQVRYIWRVLLIFSHSFYDERINYLVKSIKFCRVMQIFYPFSLQLYPGRYSAADGRACNESNAARAADPGPCAQRDLRRAQSKLHWWWTANYVFEGEWGLDDRIVIFLQEDDYVLPDLLYVTQIIWRGILAIPAVDVVALGGTNLSLDYSLLKIDSWVPAYEKGLAFTTKTWLKIAERTASFCFYDDYRWSQSLVPVFGNFSGGFAEMAACAAPRVLSTRGCASARQAARSAWLSVRRTRLFPLNMSATLTVGAQGRPHPPHAAGPTQPAGWGDPQDQMLCLDPLMKDATVAPPDTNLFTKD